MKLKYIKLAGFKSFADPVVLEFPERVTAIVGPNGCGKSNIVDAIRWVTGATPRSLRGATLEDVVFQGTGSRKPQALASVELVFDNSEGSLEGRYAEYSEIALRRTTNRARESKYFLNGTQCRRKDITDLLQGTGLTGNKYSIIEQGMISNIVGAKPEDLRGYVEEAAGLSHYKDSRRDAEARMRRTRENLDRVLDIRTEVSKQLSKLKTQTRDAERFVELKQKKKQLETDIALLKRRDLQRKGEDLARRLESARTDEEKERTSLLSAETRIEEINRKTVDADAALNKVKEEIYKVNVDVTALEGEIKSGREGEAQLRAERAELKNKIATATAEMEDWRAKRQNFGEKHAQLSEEAEAAKATANEIKAELDRHTGANEDVANRLSARDGEERASRERIEVEKAKIAMLDEELARLAVSGRELAERQGRNAPDALEAAARESDKALQAAKSAVETAQAELKEVGEAIENGVRRIRVAENVLQTARTREHELQGRIESLRATQEDMLHRNNKAIRAWLKSNGISMDGQLVSTMRLDAQWEAAGEAVLGAFLDAVKVESLDHYADRYPAFDGGVLTLFEDGAPADAPTDAEGTLASKASKCGGMGAMLERVRLADSLSDALARRGELRDGETFVTPDGAHVGRYWLRLYKPQSGDEGVLSRRRDIERVGRELEACKEENRRAAEQVDNMRRRQADEEARRKNLYDELAGLRERSATLAAEAEHGRKAAAQAREAHGELKRQSERVRARIAEVNEERARAADARDKAEKRTSDLRERYGDLDGAHVDKVARVKACNERLNEAHDKLRRLEVDGESARIGGENASEHIRGLAQRIEEMQKRGADLERLLAKAGEPSDDKDKRLEALLERKAKLEQQRVEGEGGVNALRTELKNREARRREAQTNVDRARAKKGEVSVELQVAQAKEKELNETLEGLDPEATAPEGATLDEKAADLENTRRRMERMGAINLAAVEEYKEMSERKNYLDAQDKDLTDAMASLKKSIKKMDDESSRRFVETLEKINAHLKIVFPQLFGGGTAELKMIGDDTLSDGVIVTARPAGKRMTSIHLLSGGEKALLAAAVLLSIFELRPAPFCVLDEVDAPLDDHNVDRFCALLRTMSERVQLIMATHNKISMEYADALIGVTMREAGVTRPVSVNVDEAAKMVTA